MQDSVLNARFFPFSLITPITSVGMGEFQGQRECTARPAAEANGRLEHEGVIVLVKNVG